MTYRLFPGWRANDEWLLPALRTVFSYTERSPDRATGWLYLTDRPPLTPWPPAFAGLGRPLLDDLEATTGVRFTAVAYQAYLNGAGVDWHHDRSWDAQAILSLGKTRAFGIRNGQAQVQFLLQHGDLLYMPPGFQDEWEHCVPTEKVSGERCSLVFRSTKE